MKKAAIITCLIVLAAFLLGAETIANVTVQKGLSLTIDRGAMDGVEVGMKGIVKAVYRDPGGEYTINIGIFTVQKVAERTAELTLEVGKGLNAADARYVVFEQELAPAEKKPAAAAAAPPPAARSAEWYLEQGDLAAEASDFKAALELFKKALALAPKNLVVQEKCSEMKKAIAAAERGGKFREYLKQADANYEKQSTKFAFLYLIEALRLYPEGRDEVKRRLDVMEREYPGELAAILDEKSAELKDIRPEIDALLAAQAAPSQEPAAPAAGAEKPAEEFLRKVGAKAKEISRNEKGYWEAAFDDDITLIYIPAGEFTIGSPDRDGDSDEHPAHKVFLAGYWIGRTEVTFAQYDRFCSETGRQKAADEGWGRGKRPAIYVTWSDAADFCAWMEKRTGLKFRLPSEAEWEKAARDRFPWGSAPPDRDRANFDKEHMMTLTVGSFPAGASPYGLLDMAGNVWEWTQDWYDPGFYGDSPRENPRGPKSGTERVVRGGSWANGAELIRAANRSSENPGSRLNILGFRLALDGD